RDRAGVPLLPEDGDDRREIAFARTRDDVGGAWSIVPHAHIKGAVEPERKASPGLIELRRGHPEIEHNAFDRSVDNDRLQVGETLFDQFELAARFLDQIGAAGDRALIAVETDHADARSPEDRARIAAGSEGSIDIATTRARREPFGDLGNQYGNVSARSAGEPALITGCDHGEAPAC